MRHNWYKFAIVSLLILPAVFVHAQTVPPIQYVVSPETPGPHETVTIEVQGVGTFLGSATLVWTQDGKIVKSGVGERSYSFTTGSLGQKTTIHVSIDSSQGAFAQTFIFNPTTINLVWEANTTLPPLYMGKALYSAGSAYKVVAYPVVYSGASRVAQSALTYQWSYKGDPVPEQSGLGRYQFTNTGDELQSSEDIGVDVYYGSAKVGTASLSIPASDPKILLYQYDPARGVLYDAVIPSSVSLIGQEITLQAVPYFFSTQSMQAGQIPYAWTLNGDPTTGPDSARGILTLRQTGSGAGEADVGVSLQNNNPDQFVQTASTALHLVFGTTAASSISNLFGL